MAYRAPCGTIKNTQAQNIPSHPAYNRSKAAHAAERCEARLRLSPLGEGRIFLEIVITKELFNEAYLPYLFDYSRRYEVYYGGRSSGKSYFIVDKLVIKGLNSKRRMLFLMKEGNKVNDTVWQMLKDSLYKFQIFGRCKINKSEHSVELPNGTWIKCLGCDDPEKLKGQVNITDVWFEEATKFTLDDFELADGTIRGKADDKQIFVSFNPVSKQNWVYDYFGFSAGVTPPDTLILKTTYKHNRWCDAATINRLERLKERNPIRYKIEAEGDFATLDRLVIPRYEKEDFNWLEKLHSGNRTFLCIGVDFGFNDPTALVASVADEDTKTLWIFDEHYERGMLNADIARMIHAKGFQKEIIYFDSAEPKSIQEVREGGVTRARKASKGRGSIISGIKKLLEYRIVVHPNCQHLIDEFDNYCYKKNKNTGEYTEEPLDNGWNHEIDALRYSLQCIKSKAKIIGVKL